MSASPPLAEQEHRRRAGEHHDVGRALHQAAENEWAAVCYFYAAYHLVKTAMLLDPIWSNAPARVALHLELTPDDRFCTRHHGSGRSGDGRMWGINELVLLMYPQIVKPYERLHQASIQVRYGAGLPKGALPSLLADLEAIKAASDAGTLVA